MEFDMGNGIASAQRMKAWSNYEAAAATPGIEAAIIRRVSMESDDCWLWLGTHNANGYARISVGRRSMYVHRLAVLVFNGPFDPACDIDHLCRTPGCVNPAHLEAVTHRENQSRGMAGPRSHCVHGHEYTPENTRWRTSRGIPTRKCMTCSSSWKGGSNRVRDAARARLREERQAS